MPTPYNSVLFKVEDAIYARLQTIADDLTGWHFLKGFGSETMRLPVAGVVADSASERQPFYCGNYNVEASVSLYASAIETNREALMDAVAKITDLLADDEIATSLSSDRADFTVKSCRAATFSQSKWSQGHIYTIGLQLVCFSSDV